MSYSNALVRNDELDFPHPPLWLVWTGDEHYYGSDYIKRTAPEKYAAHKGKGKVRHLMSLDRAKKRVSGYAVSKRNLEYLNNQQRPEYRVPAPNGTWMVGEWTEDWAIYEWTGEKYELRYEGKRGGFKDDCPLFQTPVKKNAGAKLRVVPESDIEAAKRSILEAS